jgi:hypothetical protein
VARGFRALIGDQALPRENAPAPAGDATGGVLHITFPAFPGRRAKLLTLL